MTEKKTILVLANSTKKGGRCVAGRELIENDSDGYTIGPWIRPIDAHGAEGTIDERRTVINGRTLLPLEIIEVSCTGSANDPLHPEDWTIDRATVWTRVEDARPDALAVIEDDAGDLWGPASASSRRVAPVPGTPTLKLIRPRGKVTVTAYKDEPPWGGVKFRRYIDIEHDGVTHRLPIDDPEFIKRHKLDATTIADRHIQFDLDPKKTVVVASLTPPFSHDGLQYKIAATILEL